MISPAGGPFGPPRSAPRRLVPRPVRGRLCAATSTAAAGRRTPPYDPRAVSIGHAGRGAPGAAAPGGDRRDRHPRRVADRQPRVDRRRSSTVTGTWSSTWRSRSSSATGRRCVWLWFASRRWGTGDVLADLGVRFRWVDLGWGPLIWIVHGRRRWASRSGSCVRLDVPYRGNLDVDSVDPLAPSARR